VVVIGDGNQRTAAVSGAMLKSRPASVGERPKNNEEFAAHVGLPIGGVGTVVLRDLVHPAGDEIRSRAMGEECVVLRHASRQILELLAVTQGGTRH